METPTRSPERDAVLGRIDEIAPVLRELAPRADLERRLPTPAVEALLSAGLFRASAPSEVGGLSLDPLTQLEVFEAVAAVDGAAGWNLMISTLLASILGSRLDDHGTEQVFGSEQWPVIAGLVWPRGRAIAADGGYTVSGRWSFGSGINQAQWAIGGCRLFDGDQPRTGPGGVPATTIAVLPIDEVEVLDTWHVAGLRGTGSCDYSAEGVFVSDSFVIDPASGPRRGDAWLRLPAPALVAVGHGGFALGVASGVLRELEEHVGTSSRSMTQTSIGERESFQLSLGRYRVQLDAARTLMMEAHRATWETVCADGMPSAEQLRRMRLSGVHATELAVEIAQFAFKAAGSAALYESSPLQRALRDILAAQQHIYVREQAYADYAKDLLKASAGRSGDAS